MPIPIAPYIHLSKSPADEPTPGCPTEPPMKRDAHPKSLHTTAPADFSLRFLDTYKPFPQVKHSEWQGIFNFVFCISLHKLTFAKKKHKT
jgi:hypothetical protein